MNRNNVKLGKVTQNTDDSEQFPQMQTTYMGKVCDVTLIQPYGLTSRPPDNALCVVLNQQAQEGTRLAVAFSPNLRESGLLAGETCLQNMVSGVKMKLTNDGDLLLDVPRDMVSAVIRDVVASAKTVTVNVDETMDITAGTKITINAPELELNIPLITINGATMNVIANTAFTGTLTSNGKNISDTHTHGGVTPGSGTSGVVT